MSHLAQLLDPEVIETASERDLDALNTQLEVAIINEVKKSPELQRVLKDRLSASANRLARAARPRVP
jgi:hypothetical protein